MKNLLVYLLGMMLFGMVGFGNNTAEAASVPDCWNQKLKCEKGCPRFQVLKSWDDAAVLDKETGLVWERSPDGSNKYAYDDAHTHCNNLVVSNRMGWRVPTVQELASLVDTTQANPAIPSGHPFSNLQNDYYWSTTISNAGGLDSSWLFLFGSGFAGRAVKSNAFYVWCVRGVTGVDVQR